MSRILDAPSAGEPLQRAFDRKERELYALFDSLGDAQRVVFHARLANAPTDDEIISRLSRFTAERRNRIISFLVNRRRVA